MIESGAETIIIRADLGGGGEGYLVVDTTFRNGSAGGLRVAEDLSIEEVATLAREMTLKFSFIGRAAGGAKSGLKLPAGAGPDEKRRLLGELGRHLGPLLRRGIYSAGTDMNCSGDDLKVLYRGAGLRLGRTTDTALFTAIGAADALAAGRQSLGRRSRPLRVAVEGLGAVATWLVGRLPPDQFTVTAVSTVRGAVVAERGFDPGELADKKARFGDAVVDHLEGDRGPAESVFSADVDVFIPSARTWSVTRERARALRASLVAPLANAPYGEGAVDLLEARGVVCLPGFVVNCGGVFASSLFDSGVPLAEVEQLSRRHFRAVVAALLAVRAASGVSPVALAEQIALERLSARIAANAPESPYRRVARTLAGELVPRRISRRAYLRRFTRNLVRLEQRILEHGGRAAGAAGAIAVGA
jgi:glutamate dehydrogenase (NAD(P)+)